MELPLKHTSLSCAQYQHGDDLGKLLAYAALAPVFLLCFQLSKVYTRREVHEAVLLIGLVMEEAVARALKHVLKHPRPATCKMLHLCHSHGMPSSHTSMACCYLSVTTCLAIMLWNKRRWISRVLSVLEQLAIAAAAAGVAWSRVYLGYHSTDQVLAGAVLGVLFGVLLFVALDMLQPLYRVLANTPYLMELGVKDTYGSPEPLRVEQQAHLLLSGKAKHKPN